VPIPLAETEFGFRFTCLPKAPELTVSVIGGASAKAGAARAQTATAAASRVLFEKDSIL